ncbi:MAG: hypothetical protein RMK52_01815 [Chitinophagales bacterium]|nr:hypothetical protein [Chitinophagales bacterium]MDW8392961.1 hypothetical protein [Chitinophagales bacterium]
MLPASLFLHLAVVPGVGFSVLQQQDQFEHRDNRKISVVPHGIAQAAVGYSGQTYYAIGSANYYGSWARSDQDQFFQFQSEKFKLTLGRRW